MKKEYFDQVIVKAGEDMLCDMKLTYYLLTGAISEEYCDLEVYGVEIEKELVSGRNSEGIERKLIKDLFFKKSEAVEFLNKISCNKVTPMELKYVLRDYIYDQINSATVNN